MTLALYFHPLSSFSQKALVALYENGTAFEKRLLDPAVPDWRAPLERLWPIGKFPVLRDEARGQTVPEATIIIEYLALHYPGEVALVPADPERARQTRLADRFFDLYVNVPMQKIVTDRLRPEGRHDPHGVAEARTLLARALEIVERDMGARTWATGEAFTTADCAAAPALFYAARVATLGPNAAAYLRRLSQRPSYARALEEARPYLHMFPEG